MRKLILIIAILPFVPLNLKSQSSTEYNPIATAVPFLNDAPDARGMGNGYTGAATAPDASSNFWNPAKFAFINDSVSLIPNGDMGASLSYFNGTLNLLKNQIHSQFSIYKSFKNQSISSSLKYDSYGEIIFTDQYGSPSGSIKPLDFYIDLAYSRKLSRVFSGAIALRYLQSDNDIKILEDYKKGKSIAMDIAFYYTKNIKMAGMDRSNLSFGLNISNIGSKMSFSKKYDGKDFIPTNLRLGTAFTLLQDKNQFTLSADLNKLLVPTPPIYSDNGEIVKGMDPDVSVLHGMVQSFYDAPRGFEEEMEEIYYGLGVEYWYNKTLALRTGYYNEHENKGGRKYYTIGIGGKYRIFGLDFTYLFNQKRKNEFFRNSWYATFVVQLNTQDG